MIFNARNAAFFAPELTLLVAAGEQEDLCPFFASRHHGALAFLVPKRLPYGTESSLGSGVLGGSRRVDGLRAVFLLVACCYQEGAGPAPLVHAAGEQEDFRPLFLSGPPALAQWSGAVLRGLSQSNVRQNATVCIRGEPLSAGSPAGRGFQRRGPKFHRFGRCQFRSYVRHAESPARVDAPRGCQAF